MMLSHSENASLSYTCNPREEITHGRAVLDSQLCIAAFLVPAAVIGWACDSSAVSMEDGRALRARIWFSWLVAYDVLAVNSYIHFFPGPVIVEILIATCIGLAALTAKPRGAASTGTVHGSATAFHSQ
jgi:hypothetical protein